MLLGQSLANVIGDGGEKMCTLCWRKVLRARSVKLPVLEQRRAQKSFFDGMGTRELTLLTQQAIPPSSVVRPMKALLKSAS